MHHTFLLPGKTRVKIPDLPDLILKLDADVQIWFK